MIRGDILQDINKYKPKFIGPFNVRQFVCVLLSLAAVLPTYFGLKWLFEPFPLIVICCIVATPFILCGWFSPYGIPLEKFVFNYIKSHISPKNRKYEISESTYDLGDECYKLQDAVSEGEDEEIKGADISSSGAVGTEEPTISKAQKKKNEKEAKKQAQAAEKQLEKDIKALGSDYKPYN